MPSSGLGAVTQRNAKLLGDVVPLELRVKRHPVPVDLSRPALDAIKNHGHACSKCAEAAGVQDKTVIADLSYDEDAKVDGATWSRIKANTAAASWETRDALMDAMGNELPLMWELHKRGWDPSSLRRYESDVERENRELRETLQRERQERAVIVEFVKQARAA